MAVTTLQISQTGAKVRFSTTSIFARWVMIQNNASHVCRVGDTNVSTTVGASLPASNVANSVMFLPPLADNGTHYDLSQFYTIGTNADVLDVVYDSRT